MREPYGTKFVESEAILAAQDNNTSYLMKILDGMTSIELRSLMHAARFLAEECEERL